MMRILDQLRRSLARAAALLRREDGSVSAEFVIIIPTVLTVALSSFDAGLLATRSAMLERAVDMTMRDLRLGLIKSPTHDTLKQIICDRAPIFQDCFNSLMLDLRPIDTTTWSPLSDKTSCIDRSADVQPLTTFQTGGDDTLMLVRACMIVDPMFPTSGYGLGLSLDASGGFHLVTASAFVNEPK